MTDDEYKKYHKFHRMTMTYAEAEKYIMAGWQLDSVNRVLLRGINKEIEQCCLSWTKDDNPVEP